MDAIVNHPLYSGLDSIENIRLFMENHVFSVWIFMSLLRRLLDLLSPETDLWVPPLFHQPLRTLRHIWIEEETDMTPDGRIQSHLEIYLQGMQEINASVSEIHKIIIRAATGNEIRKRDIDELKILPGTKSFLHSHIDILKNNTSFSQLFTYFTFGRELLIPQMFESLLNTVRSILSPSSLLIYYLERHITLDENHGALLLDCDIPMDPVYQKKAYDDRLLLWNGIYEALSDTGVSFC